MSRPSARTCLLGLLLAASSLPAQEPEVLRREVLESQRRLEQIRTERARLRREMEQIRARVGNVPGALQNIERQISVSRSVLAEIDFQSQAASDQVRRTTSELLRNRDRVRERQAILDRRIRDIYKMGPLHTARVLLGADSLTDLLNRYRYLSIVAAWDRALMTGVQTLQDELNGQNQELQEGLRELARLREAQLGEVVELRQIEEEHERTRLEFRSREMDMTDPLTRMEPFDFRLSELVSDLERQRMEGDWRGVVAGLPIPPAATSSLADVGTLDWPVQGEVVYRFGTEEQPGGAAGRRSGIGIRAALGTPVHAVRPGTVVLAGPLEGYGPSVILGHGAGYYTLYLYLEEIGVVEGRTVNGGQVVGTVGGRDTPEGAHLGFQIRAPLDGGPPQALNPLPWLRPEGSGG